MTEAKTQNGAGPAAGFWARLWARPWTVGLAGIAMFAALLGGEIWAGMRANGGVFCYSLDDAYIHMAMARSLAQHGVWGLNPASGFASASSSPGWTLLLAACVRVLGDRVWLSLALNALFAAALLLFADRTMRRWLPAASVGSRLVLQAGLVLLVPLPSLALVGMEHCAQAFAVTAMVVLAVEAGGARSLPGRSHHAAIAGETSADGHLAQADPAELRGWRRGLLPAAFLAATAFLAAALRYETVFAVAAVLGLLLCRRRPWLAGAVAVAAAIPPVLFAIYARQHGPFWLPFSVLAKADVNHARAAWIAWAHFVPFGPKITLASVAIAAAALAVAGRRRFRLRALTAAYLAIYAMHLTLAPVGWLMRYEGYLVGLGWLAVSLGLAATWPDWRKALRPDWQAAPQAGWQRQSGRRVGADAVAKDKDASPNYALLAAVLALGLIYPAWLDRAWTGITYPAQAMHDRYLEHLQPARFLARTFDHSTVVASDVGMISYYSDARVLDPMGLGSAEPLLARRNGGRFTADDMHRWAQRSGAQVAVIETGWRQARELVPAAWVPVETWHFPRNVVYSNLEVTFFAVRPEDAETLRRKLAAFALPDGMTRTRPADGNAPMVIDSPLTGLDSGSTIRETSK